jgi:hypothetical protein
MRQMIVEQTIMPVSRRDRRISVNVSLRGSLASQYYELLNKKSKDEATSFIEHLLKTKDIDIIRSFEDEAIVIGRKTDRGHYNFDW